MPNKKSLYEYLESRVYPNLYVVIEGVTCSGKTTVGKILSNVLDGSWEYYKRPINAEKIERINRSAFERLNKTGCYDYLADLITGNKEVLKLLKEGYNIVRDRNAISHLTTLEIIGPECPLRKNCLEGTLNAIANDPKPDYLFILDAPFGELIRRSKAKQLSKYDSLFLKKDFVGMYKKLISAKARNLYNTDVTEIIEINTESLSPDGVAKLIKRKIKRVS